MATYATFKHVELHKVGHGKNRVPNAPRGCIGEIFGDGTSNGAQKKSTDVCDTPSRPKDTHSRLFGAPPRPPTAVRDTMKSNIKFGEGGAPQVNGNGHTNGHSNGHVNGQSPSPAKDGNPVTGEGYKSINGEINTSVTSLNGNLSPINHNRIPPGGFSSGLW